mgnify:CR=1 FL=1
MILLKSIYENTNDRMCYILKLDEIVVVFNQNQLKGEQMMTVEEGLLKEKGFVFTSFTYRGKIAWEKCICSFWDFVVYSQRI